MRVLLQSFFLLMTDLDWMMFADFLTFGCADWLSCNLFLWPSTYDQKHDLSWAEARIMGIGFVMKMWLQHLIHEIAHVISHWLTSFAIGTSWMWNGALTILMSLCLKCCKNCRMWSLVNTMHGHSIGVFLLFACVLIPLPQCSLGLSPNIHLHSGGVKKSHMLGKTPALHILSLTRIPTGEPGVSSEELSFGFMPTMAMTRITIDYPLMSLLNDYYDKNSNVYLVGAPVLGPMQRHCPQPAYSKTALQVQVLGQDKTWTYVYQATPTCP